MLGISTSLYIRRMTSLIRALESAPAKIASASEATRQGSPATWRLDNTSSIGGAAVSIEGSPRVVTTESGPAVEFNGRTDGLIVETNPLRGLRAFTLEAEFLVAGEAWPDRAEQRFVHIEETGTANRALIELRLLDRGRWTLDTYLRSGAAGVTLLDTAAAHPTDRWHVASLVYDGTTMTHFVDGRRELSAAAEFVPLASGRTAIGMRLNRVSYFQGRIRQIRITPEALPAGRLLVAAGRHA